MSEYLDSSIQYFNNSNIGVNLTTVLIDDEPWFIAKEVANILGYENAPKAITDHIDAQDQRMLSFSECKELFGGALAIDEGDNEYSETVVREGNLKLNKTFSLKNPMSISNRGMKLINEAGLYTLTIKSDKPEAKPFRRWVTSEVLPSIRKTGSYGISISKEERLMLNVLTANTKEDRLVALDALEQHHREEKRALEAENEALTQERDKAIKTKSQINDKRTASLMGKTGALTKENTKLKNKLQDTEEQLETANTKIETLEAEREIALRGLYHKKEVAKMIKDKYIVIAYADKTLVSKVDSALKTLALTLREKPVSKPNPKDDSYPPMLYYSQRIVDQLFECIERDIDYLKSFK